MLRLRFFLVLGTCVCIYAESDDCHLSTAGCVNRSGAPIENPCASHVECTTAFSRCVNSVCVCIDGYRFSENECRLTSGFYKDTCESQEDCKGRFTYCNIFTECDCLNGYSSQGQHCVALEHDVNTCENSHDCNKKFTICVDGRCNCKIGFYLQGHECVPIKGALGDWCDSNNLCAIPNALCNYNECQCNSYFYQQGHDCVSRIYVPMGQKCYSDSECPVANSFCEETQCFCSDGYKQIGYECVSSQSDNFSRATRFTNGGQRPYLPSNLGNYCENNYDCGDSLPLTCNLRSSTCVCAEGFKRMSNECVFTGIASPNEPPYHQKRHIHVNSNQRRNKPSLSQPSFGNEYENPHFESYIPIRVPAFPANVRSGVYGHRCVSSNDCYDFFSCNPRSQTCECQRGFVLEGPECVRNIPLFTRSSFDPSVSHIKYSPHGQTCSGNADCYNELLICDLFTYKCVCSPKAKSDGSYCIFDESSRYQPKNPELSQSPPLQRPTPPKQRPIYPQSPVIHQPSFTPSFPSTRDHDDVSHRSTSSGFIPSRPPYVVNPQNHRVSGEGGECSENKHCFDEFEYCNKAFYRCECKKGYTRQKEICVQLRVGDFCTSHEDCLLLNNAHCENSGCVCNYGYQNVNGHCEVPQNRGRAGYCYVDDDCKNYNYTQCLENKCQCANLFVEIKGNCVPPREALPEYCDEQRTCEIEYSECDWRINYCVCKKDYSPASPYSEICRPDGSLYGRCRRDGSCENRDLTCYRKDFKCRCARGLKESTWWKWKCVTSTT